MIRCDLEADVLPELLPEYLSCGAFQSPPREQEESSGAMLVSLDGFAAGGVFSDEGEHASVAQDPYSVGVDDDDFQAFSLTLPYSDTPSRGGVEELEQATPDSSTRASSSGTCLSSPSPSSQTIVASLGVNDLKKKVGEETTASSVVD